MVRGNLLAFTKQAVVVERGAFFGRGLSAVAELVVMPATGGCRLYDVLETAFS